MSAIAPRWGPERIRLWTASTFVVLLAHGAIFAAVMLHVHHMPQPPPGGSQTALDVEVADWAAPASSSQTANRSPLEVQQKQRSLTREPSRAARPIHPVAELKSIAERAYPTPSPPGQPATGGPASAVGALPALTASTRSGTPSVTAESSDQVRAWLAQIQAHLQPFKSYPRSAIAAHQQDTVALELFVNAAGKVSSLGIYSRHRYPALEQQVRKMLKLAGPLPTPPPGVSNQTVAVLFQFHLLKSKAARTVSNCAPPIDPGAAPAAGSATEAELRTYRARLDVYIAESRVEANCLGAVASPSALRTRATVISHADQRAHEFNALAQSFLAIAKAKTLRAQEARQQQTQKLAGSVYMGCTAPTALQGLPQRLTRSSALTYRRDLLGYQNLVRQYLDCLDRAGHAAFAANPRLTAMERGAISNTAASLARAAALPLNQRVTEFNTRLSRLNRQHIRPAQPGELAEVLVRARAAFEDSSWTLPASVAPGNCVRITRTAHGYQASLCKTLMTGISTYHAGITSFGASAFDARRRRVMAKSSGIFIAPDLGISSPNFEKTHPYVGGSQIDSGYAGIRRTQPIVLSVQGLRVGNARLSFTIEHVARGMVRSKGVLWQAIQLNLALAPDGKSLQGYCRTQKKRWVCILPRER